MNNEKIMESEHQTIDWSYPEPRKGLKRTCDKFIGPGATAAELWIGIAAALFAGVTLLVYAWLANLNWSILQYVLAIFIAADLFGGVVVNATSSAKRWYHRKGQGFKEHFFSLQCIFTLSLSVCCFVPWIGYLVWYAMFTY